MKSSLTFLLVLITAVSMRAATFTVINTNDSGPGSLRQAIADGSAGFNNQITFNIPGTGVQTINLLSPVSVAAGLTIDGYTQPGAKANSLAVGTNAVLLIEITGNKAQPTGTAFQLNQSSTIRGLVINGFAIDVDIRSSLGQNAKVVGCYLETNADGSAAIPSAQDYLPVKAQADFHGNVAANIGGPTPADRNVIAGPIRIVHGNLGQPYSFAAIVGNYIGVSADGKSFLAPGASVSFVENASAAITNNVIAGYVVLAGSPGTVTGNLIGTDAFGTTASPGAFGVSIYSSVRPGGGGTGGGTVVGNVIATANSSAAVSLAKTFPSTVKGNWIGVASDGKTPLGNASTGIDVHDTANAAIGGVNAGDGNVIRFAVSAGQIGAGINEIGSTGLNFIEGNSISGRGGLGIDLGTAGVTPNDVNDADGIQNYPVLTSVEFSGSHVRVTGSLNSTANTTLRIEFFGNDSADPSGYGQGQSYLGFTVVTTEANGNASFDVTLPVPASTRAISSTATGRNGTSEFSARIFAKLLNISTRADVGTDDNTAIAGFIVTGTDSKKVLVRGIGPSMQVGGVPVPGRLADPLLDVWDSSNNLLAENDNWTQSQRAEIQATGLAPTNAKESAVLLDLMPGAYTVQLSGVHAGMGIGLIEVYDLTQVGSELANISTRSLVETGDNVMIAGCIVAPNTGRGASVLVRGIGPSIPGIANSLPDPMIELYDANGQLLASNDDWKANEAQIRATGLPPANDHESALVADLVPNSYTLVLRGKDNATGVGLVEIYHLP